MSRKYNYVRKQKETDRKRFSQNFSVHSFIFFQSFIFRSSKPNPNQSLNIQSPQAPSTPEQQRLQRFKAAARSRLVKKLTGKRGTASPIVILPPFDYTNLQKPEVVTETIRKSIQVYDPKINIRLDSQKMSALNLEEFRKATNNLKSDVIVITVMHPTNFDLYLYDARTPFQIYAHSEPIAGAAQYELTKEAAQYYTKILVRRTLYRYIKNQYYELPREQTPLVLQAEIPRYLTSQESIERINREAHANFYAGVGLGAALSSGRQSGKYWNSNLVSLEVGYKILPDVFGGVGLDMSAYNVANVFGKYMVSDKQKFFKLSVGLSLGYSMWRKTLNWDETDAIRNGTTLLAPSLCFLLPIQDVYLKAEGKAYIGLNRRAIILTIAPGLLLQF